MNALWNLAVERHAALGQHLLEHLFLTSVAVAIALVIGLPLGLWVTRNAKARGPILGAAGVIQTIPSIALLGLLLPFLGIGVKPAIVALALYALLPIIRNTYAGLDGVDAALLEAADGLGFREGQRFWRIELPLALPVIVAGIRTATVICVGVATLAAFIGAGGLGQFIVVGLQRNHVELILLGAIPSAILALLLDFAIGQVETSLSRNPVTGRKPSASRAVAWAAVPAVLVTALGFGLQAGQQRTPRGETTGTVAIGSKNFTEQHLLGEMLAMLVEDRTTLAVDREFGLEGTRILHAAMVRGDIDCYVEYTGTGLMDVLKLPAETDADQVYDQVAAEYASRYGIRWLDPLGFNNTYAITVRAAAADEHGWDSISDLRPSADGLRAGFTGEFIEREDGYIGFQRQYGFGFGQVDLLDPGLMYSAIANGDVDVICGFGTDGRIPAFDLRMLADDRHLFPPYQAAPIVLEATLAAHPELQDVLNALAHKIDDETMQTLNYTVDEERRPVAEVAREYLVSQGLLTD